MVGRFVIDTSVTVAWCLEDEGDEYARLVENAVGSGEACAPTLWLYETANALAIAQRRKRISASERNDILLRLAALRIAVVPPPSNIQREVIDLAIHSGLTAYDAAYLALALQERIPLATLDDELAEAASKSRIPILFEKNRRRR